jgi:D-3-phosphoglycerate dehydrogenase
LSRLTVALVSVDGPGLPDWVRPRLEDQGIRLVSRRCGSPAEVLECAHDADVVWLFGGGTMVTPQVLESLPRCGAVLRTGSGTDNVPTAAATELGIYVANTPEAIGHTVAEHAIALLMSACRKVAAQDRAVRAGVWSRDHAWPDWRLTGHTLGLVGFGRIARLVARKLSGFDMRVLAADPAIPPDEVKAAGAEPSDLASLLEQADYVSIHCPLTDQTRGLIGTEELRRMKRRAILVNTSRGPVVDEAALLQALQEGWIAGAALDVLEHEPPRPGHPLLKLDQVVITPHIAGYSDAFWAEFWSHSIRTLVAMAEKRRPLWVVNPEVQPRWAADH